MKKISIVIPNYNNEKYIEQCIFSVINQDYPEKEIIVVDDGSIDNSVAIVKKIIDKNNTINIKLIVQPNSNGSVARNRGIENVTGDYVLFLDSDDLLEKNVLSEMINACEKDSSDLLIGNYEIIDENNSHVGNRAFANERKICSLEKDFAWLADMSPVPSNKLFNMKIIRKNNLWWENVRIGQDLGFYLKYLALCEKITMLNTKVYRYRIVSNSVTRSYDLKIFDIVNVFNGIRNYYLALDKMNLYELYIPIQELKHYKFQMYKQWRYDDRKMRLLIMNFFAFYIEKINFSNCKGDKKWLKKNLSEFRKMYRLRFILTSEWFKRHCERKAMEGRHD